MIPRHETAKIGDEEIEARRKDQQRTVPRVGARAQSLADTGCSPPKFEIGQLHTALAAMIEKGERCITRLLDRAMLEEVNEGVVLHDFN